MVSKTDKILEEYNSVRENIKLNTQSLKEAFLSLGFICVKAIRYNQPTIIQEMRETLELDVVDLLESKHISAFIKRSFPGHESYITLILPSEWKDQSKVREQPFCASTSANFVMHGDFLEWAKELTPMCKDGHFKILSLIHEKRAAREPSISDILDVWDRIGIGPQECVGGLNWVKHGKLL